jgi:hypothetical protein
MADWKVIGNYAELAVFAASLALWLRILIKWIKGVPALAVVERPAVSWEIPPVCATFLVAYFLPAFVIELACPVDLRSPEGALWRQSPEAVPWHLACSLVQIVAVVALLRLAGPLQKADFGCDLAGWRNDVLVGAGGFLASIGPVFLITMLQQHLGWRHIEDKHDFFKILDNGDDSGVVYWIIATVVVVVPMAEELLYRVLLQGSVQSQLRPWMAIVFSTVIFCLRHNPADMLPLVPLALILGYIYYRRRSYVALVVAHGMFNALFITLALLKGS